jgi:hypothetical protein
VEGEEGAVKDWKWRELLRRNIFGLQERNNLRQQQQPTYTSTRLPPSRESIRRVAGLLTMVKGHRTPWREVVVYRPIMVEVLVEVIPG